MNCAVSSKLQKILLESLEFYIKKYEILENDFLCTSVFLNPEYRSLSHCETEFERENVKTRAIEFIKKFKYLNEIIPENNSAQITRSTSNDSIDSFNGATQDLSNISLQVNGNIIERKEHELITYNNLIAEPKIDCSTFWLMNESKLPLLKQVAREVLTAIATSVPSEKVFSDGSNQIWSLRNRLCAARVEKLMFLLSNLDKETPVLEIQSI